MRVTGSCWCSSAEQPDCEATLQQLREAERAGEGVAGGGWTRAHSFTQPFSSSAVSDAGGRADMVEQERIVFAVDFTAGVSDLLLQQPSNERQHCLNVQCNCIVQVLQNECTKSG